MSEALLGGLLALGGTLLGIVGTIVAARLAAGDEQRRRKRDHEIRQIATTVHIVDRWADVAQATLSGNSAKLAAAQKALRDSDKEWDWDVDLIPGGAARELRDLSMGISQGSIQPDPSDPLELSSRLMRLQTAVRAQAAKRTRDLQ